MAAQWPLVVDQILTTLPTLTGWGQVTVFDGAAYDAANASYVTVGHASDGIITTAGSYSSQQHPNGAQRLESGSVACQLMCTDDDPEQATNRSAVFALMDALEAWVREDRRLGGVLSQDGTSDLAVDISSSQNVPDSSYSLMFSINYTTAT
jgi:hypothetical protein